MNILRITTTLLVNRRGRVLNKCWPKWKGILRHTDNSHSTSVASNRKLNSPPNITLYTISTHLPLENKPNKYYSTSNSNNYYQHPIITNNHLNIFIRHKLIMINKNKIKIFLSHIILSKICKEKSFNKKKRKK